MGCIIRIRPSRPTCRHDVRGLSGIMAATAWNESREIAAPDAASTVVGADSLVQRVRSMALVRRLVAEIVEGDGEQLDSDLSDGEWEQLCRMEERADSEESAIAQVILRAYALKNVLGATPGTDPPLIPEDFGDPTILTRSPMSERSESPEVLRSDDPSPVPAGVRFDAQFGSSSTTAELWLPIVGVGGQNIDVVTGQWLVVPEEETRPVGSPAAGVPHVLVPRRRRLRRERGTEPFQPAPSQVHSRTRKSVIEERQRQRWLTAASWVRNIGVIILLFVAWQLWGTAITQHHSQDALKGQFEAKTNHKTVKPPPGFTLIPATTRIAGPSQGAVMAHLQIPKIALDQFVVSGTDESDLAKGPGHYLGTAMPGQAGNVAIAGHRTTHGAPFNRLAELSIGDPIYLTAANGEQLTYIVSAAPVAVSPGDVAVLNNFGDDRLTLTTCNPEYSAVQRLIVVAAYLPTGKSRPAPIARGTGQPYGLAGSTISGWNTNLIPLVLIELAALIALGLLFRRLSNAFGREGRWLVLAPVWLALLLALFETLTNFLPAAV
jgi:sortase A